MGPGPALDGFVQEAPRSHVVIGPDGEVEPGKYDRVAVTVRDRGELRALRVPHGVRTAALAVWLDEGGSALSLTPRPEWPALQPDPLASGRRRLADRAPLRLVRARASRGRRARPAGGLARPRRSARHRPRPGGDRQGGGRPPCRSPTPTRWSRSGRWTSGSSTRPASSATSAGRSLDLSELDWGRGPTEALVRGLRGTLGVHADLPQATPLLAARVMAGLAMAGVPLSADRVAGRVAAHLGEQVTAAITAPVDLADPQAREEHSLVLRRAALVGVLVSGLASPARRPGRRPGRAPAGGLGGDGHPAARPARARARPGGPPARRRPAGAGAGAARLRARPGRSSSGPGSRCDVVPAARGRDLRRRPARRRRGRRGRRGAQDGRRRLVCPRLRRRPAAGAGLQRRRAGRDARRRLLPRADRRDRAARPAQRGLPAVRGGRHAAGRRAACCTRSAASGPYAATSTPS